MKWYSNFSGFQSSCRTNGRGHKLLKAQVQDVSRVCNAVARNDLSQKITVHVQGVVIILLKDVIDTTVCPFAYALPPLIDIHRFTNSLSLRKRLLVSYKKSAQKGRTWRFEQTN